MKAATFAPFLALSLTAACGGTAKDPSFDGTTCGNGTTFDEKAHQCIPNGTDAAGGSAGSSGGAGAAGSSGSGGNAGTDGSGGSATGGTGGSTDGSGGTSGSGGAGATGGSDAAGGSAGSPADASPDVPDAGPADAPVDAPPEGPPGCVPPDAFGNVMVTLRVMLTTSNVPATFYNGLSGGWTPVAVTASPAQLQSYTTPALRKVNAQLAGGAWLVAGGPYLNVPATAIEVWFGCQKAPSVTQITSSGPMAAYTVAFAKLQGDSGPNLWFCADKTGCGFQLAP